MDFYTQCRKLVKHDEFRSDAEMENDMNWRFAELFGVPENPIKRIFGRKSKSKFYSIEEIADILEGSGFSENGKAALEDANYLVEKNEWGSCFKWVMGSNRDGKIAYRLYHWGPSYRC